MDVGFLSQLVIADQKTDGGGRSMAGDQESYLLEGGHSRRNWERHPGVVLSFDGFKTRAP